MFTECPDAAAITSKLWTSRQLWDNLARNRLGAIDEIEQSCLLIKGQERLECTEGHRRSQNITDVNAGHHMVVCEQEIITKNS